MKSFTAEAAKLRHNTCWGTWAYLLWETVPEHGKKRGWWVQRLFWLPLGLIILQQMTRKLKTHTRTNCSQPLRYRPSQILTQHPAIRTKRLKPRWTDVGPSVAQGSSVQENLTTIKRPDAPARQASCYQGMQQQSYGALKSSQPN